MPIFYNCEQNTDEWRKLKRGIPSASEMKKILTPKTLKLSESSQAYMRRLLCEWALDEDIITDFESDMMKMGKQNEPKAADGFEDIMDVQLEKIGFITDDAGLVGCSPDRIFSRRGKRCTLELKCPDLHTHLGYAIDRGTLTEQYRIQIHTQYLVGQFDEAWSSSWCWSPKLRQIVEQCKPDEKTLKALSEAISQFVDVMVQKREFITREFGLPNVQDDKAIAAASKHQVWGGEFHVSEADVDAILNATYPEGMK